MAETARRLSMEEVMAHFAHQRPDDRYPTEAEIAELLIWMLDLRQQGDEKQAELDARLAKFEAHSERLEAKFARQSEIQGRWYHRLASSRRVNLVIFVIDVAFLLWHIGYLPFEVGH